jgi:hypothetical protein
MNIGNRKVTDGTVRKKEDRSMWLSLIILIKKTKTWLRLSMGEVNNNYCVQNEVQKVNIDISLAARPPTLNSTSFPISFIKLSRPRFCAPFF